MASPLESSAQKNGAYRLTNILLALLSSMMLFAGAQLWTMAEKLAGMSSTITEWRIVLEDAKRENRELKKQVELHLRAGEHSGADLRLRRLEQFHDRPRQ